MSSDICVTCLFLLAIAFNSDSNCNGKYVENRSPDLFPIRKLARSSITWESSDQPVSEFNENLKYLIDGDSSTFWRGPALMNGNEYQEVNLTFHFDQVIHIAKLSIEFDGSKHAPAVWSLERSIDHGKTWSIWQYFVKDPDDCELLLGVESSSEDNFTGVNVTCSPHQYHKNRSTVVDLLKTHQLITNNVKSEALNEWTRATSIRLHFYGLKLDLKHFPLLNNRNVTETYFYAVKDIEILGYCEQNGHFSDERTAFGYHCQHNTEGICCSKCKPGYRRKLWKPNTKEQPFECEPCDCNGHSDHCAYDDIKGESVCQHCLHNTTGSNCAECKAGFYRPYGKHWNHTDVCKPCDCDAFFLNGNCADETGKCECAMGYQGPHCASCSLGWTGYPDCKRCSAEGTISNEQSSNRSACSCKPNFDGKFCEKCKWPRAKYPNCNEVVSSHTQSKAIDCDDGTVHPFICIFRTLELFNDAALT